MERRLCKYRVQRKLTTIASEPERNSQRPRSHALLSPHTCNRVPCDKATIGDVVMKMIDRQVAGLYRNISMLRNAGGSRLSLQASLFRFRWLVAIRSYMLSGLLRQEKRDAITYDSFMKLYQFQGPTDTSTEAGWSPLRYACLHDSGRATHLVETLLNKGAVLELPLLK